MASSSGRRKADDRLIMALACGATVESAARQAGIGETTVYRHMREPDFKARLRHPQRDWRTRERFVGLRPTGNATRISHGNRVADSRIYFMR